MSTSKRNRRTPRFRPNSESLEGRQLLTQVIRGMDVDGDTWVLKLFGPGDVAVINQDGADGLPVPLGQPGLIKSITIGGANPGATRLVGAVSKSDTGDGRVYFQSLSETPSNPPALGIGVGTLAVDLPGFWLGATNPTATSPGSINFADGIVTLRFGGVDTTAFGINTNGRADKFSINLGLPTRIGTSIIVNSVISSSEPGTSTTPQGFQNTVDFNVAGRINLFQADSIQGDETLNLGVLNRFEGNQAGQVGTTVISGPAGQNFLGGITGFIGRIRIGGNATNFTAQVTAAGTDDASITDVFIGGETNKVTLNADTAVRHAQFGLGMDTVAINAEDIQYLGANRGAVGSTIVTERTVGLLSFGGDVINTGVFAGYTADQAGNLVAQELGQISVLVGGDVIDSVFAASVNPNEDMMFGSVDDLNGIMGRIDAKVEGSILNEGNMEVDPNSANQAFFAKRVELAFGPITPPAAPNAPYHRTPTPPRTVGVPGVGGGPKGPYFRFVKNLANQRRLRAAN